MNQRLNRVFATTGFLSISAIATLDAPRITKISEGFHVVSTVTVPRGDMRYVWLTGPWLDYASSVNGSGNIWGSILKKHDLGGKGEVFISVHAENAAIGVRTLSVSIACPIIPFDCNKGPLSFNVQVVEPKPTP